MARKSKNEKLSVVAEPPVNDPKRAEYSPPEAKERRRNRDPNAEEPRKDHVFSVASRARWGGDSDVSEQNRVSMQLDGTNANRGEEEGEGDGETVEPAKMKVDELKEALDEAGVEYGADAKKAELVQLYSDWLADNQ